MISENIIVGFRLCETTTSSYDMVERLGMSPNVLSDFSLYLSSSDRWKKKHPATPVLWKQLDGRVEFPWVSCLLVLTGRETPDEAKAVRVQRKRVIINLEKKPINIPLLAFSMIEMIGWRMQYYSVFFSIFVWLSSWRIFSQTQEFLLLVCLCKKAWECFRHNNQPEWLASYIWWGIACLTSWTAAPTGKHQVIGTLP